MKIRSIHITNFGNLSGYDAKFDDLTSFCEKNGFGKSTIAAFIRAMFYGLDTTKDNEVGFKDREHYNPFKGGRFGGNIVFEYRGKECRIEREFDSKSQTKDEMKVFVDGIEAKKKEEKAQFDGEKLFGLDKESFLRTVFIAPETDDDKISGTTKGVNAKLTGIIENEDEENLSDAIKILDTFSKDLSGRGKKIDTIKKEIRNNEEDLSNIAIKEKSLRTLYEEKGRLNEEIKKLDSDIKEAMKSNAKASNIRFYKDHLAQAAEAKKEIDKYAEKYTKGFPEDRELGDFSNDISIVNSNKKIIETMTLDSKKIERRKELEKFFPKKIPEKDETKKLEDIAAEIGKTKEKLSNSALNEEKTARFGILSDIFTKKHPSADETRDLFNMFRDREKIGNSLEAQRSSFASEKLDELSERFDGKLSDEKVDGFEKAYDDYKAAAAERETASKVAYDRSGIEAENEKRSGKTVAITASVILALILVAGIVLLVLNYKTPGLIMIALAVVLAFALAIGILFKRMNDSEKGPADKAGLERQRKISAAEDKMSIAKNRFYGIVSAFGCVENNIDADYTKLMIDIRDYNDLQEKQSEKSIDIKRAEGQLSEVESSIDDFYDEYVPNGYGKDIEGFTAFLNEEKEYSDLEKDFANSKENAQKLTDQLTEQKEIFNSMLYDLGIETDGSEDAAELAGNIDDLADELRSIKEEERSVREKSETAKRDIREASERIDSLLDRYDIKPEADEQIDSFYDRIKDDKIRCGELVRTYEKRIAEAKDFSEKNGLTEKDSQTDEKDIPEYDIDSLNKKRDDKGKARLGIDSQISELEDATSQKGDLISEREEMREKLAEFEKKNVYAVKAREFLEKADNRMREKYIKPVMERFKGYMNKIDKNDMKNVSVDKDFKVRYDIDGTMKEDKYLSSGQKSIESLCLRFAIIDVLYKDEEKPFLILDDPFVYVDSDHMKENIAVLKDLSKEYQIIYLCCHESRDIK